MRARELVGRETELARLYQFVDDEPLATRTLVLAGGAGFGKTSLWEAGVDHARTRQLGGRRPPE